MKNLWDERYQTNEFYYGKEPNSFLAAHSSRFKMGAQILCLAEGEGRNAVYLAKQGFNITAIDSSEVGLKKLHTFAQANKIEVNAICQDLDDFKFEANYWDGIVSIWCHLPSQLRLKIHRSAVNSLKPGGLFLLEAYTPEQLKFMTGGPSNPDYMPTLSMLESELVELEPLLKIETIRSITEGIGHQGVSAVVQFIGKKKYIPLKPDDKI